MKKFNYFIALVALSFVSITSCKDDANDAGCSTAWATELQDEVNARTAASQAYTANPDSTHCATYKNAAQNYVDALEEYRGCDRLTTQERNDLENEITDAEATVNAINCDGSDCADWATEVQDEINAMTAAAQAYGANPNFTNCNAYKNAAQNYLDALEPLLDCDTLTQQQRNDLEDAIDQAEAAVNAIVC